MGTPGLPHRPNHNSLLSSDLGGLCLGSGDVARPWGSTGKGKETLVRFTPNGRAWFSI